jgi:uncharacterized protein (TIGR02265 family)
MLAGARDVHHNHRHMETEQLLFDGYVDALFPRAHGAALTPEVKAALRQVGLDLDRRLQPGYPAANLRRWLEAAAPLLYPGEPLARAEFRMGARFVGGWKEPLLGRSIGVLVKLMPPKRALGRLERNFRSTDNFTRIAMVDRGPCAIDATFDDVLGVPDYFLGLLTEGASISSAVNPRVELLEVTGPGARFRMSWDA